jgi:hypothetical protein
MGMLAMAACASGNAGSGDPDARAGGGVIDAAGGGGPDGDPGALDAATLDAASSADASGADASGGDPVDAAAPGPVDAGGGSPDADPGIITGGPCLSGAPGATAYRIRWADAGGTAYVVYEVNGLPDPSDHAGAYGYQIGFTPAFVDPYLGEGGLLLDSNDFVDLELSTAGVGQIASATLSIYGRSYNTTTSGSFSWQTFSGIGAAPTDLVSNVAPYAWYSADMTTEIDPGDDGILIRIEAGPSSGVLVVNRIEICMQAS